MEDAKEPLAAVRHYIDSFNKGDLVSMAAACDAPMSILDGMAPHVWHGPTATQDWYRDVQIEGKHQGASDYFVAIEIGSDRDQCWTVVGVTANMVLP